VDEIEKLVQEKLKIILNLIRTNSTSDDVLKVTQGFRNIVEGEIARTQEVGVKTTKKQGAGAT
jgi:hypothetical protein